MVNFTVEQLKNELSRRGYYTDNLWNVQDVKEIFSVTDDEAKNILDKSLRNDATMGQIWFSINTFGDMEGHQRLDNLNKE